VALLEAWGTPIPLVRSNGLEHEGRHSYTCNWLDIAHGKTAQNYDRLPDSNAYFWYLTEDAWAIAQDRRRTRLVPLTRTPKDAT